MSIDFSFGICLTHNTVSGSSDVKDISSSEMYKYNFSVIQFKLAEWRESRDTAGIGNCEPHVGIRSSRSGLGQVGTCSKLIIEQCDQAK
ncbi:hypothetical protein M758_11G167300 [Ceratodon purpureus]|nr:hypothetical protein M758_11G167300 [Ceratodon purpureus]